MPRPSMAENQLPLLYSASALQNSSAFPHLCLTLVLHVIDSVILPLRGSHVFCPYTSLFSMVHGSSLYSTRIESTNPNSRVLTTGGGCGDGLCCLQGFLPALLEWLRFPFQKLTPPYTYIPFLSSINNITAEKRILDIYILGAEFKGHFARQKR